MAQTFEGIFFYLLYFTGLGDTVLGLQMASFAIIGLTTTTTYGLFAVNRMTMKTILKVASDT